MSTNTALLIRQVRATIQQATGRDYRIAWDTLDRESLSEMLRLLRDLEHEKRAAARRAQLTPWRRP